MRRRIKTACIPYIKEGRILYSCCWTYQIHYGRIKSEGCAFAVGTKDYSSYCKYEGGEYGMCDPRNYRNYRCFNPKAQRAALPRFILRITKAFMREKSKLQLPEDK